MVLPVYLPRKEKHWRTLLLTISRSVWKMNKWKKILLGFAYFLIINVVLLLLFDVWKFKTSTVLVSYDTLNGHNVQLIQKGHQFLTGQHSILITVDGEEICEFILIPINLKDGTPLFPSQNVIVEADSETSYKIVFNTGRDSDHYIEFDAEFKTIICIGVYEYKHISDKVELVKLEEWKSPFLASDNFRKTL